MKLSGIHFLDPDSTEILLPARVKIDMTSREVRKELYDPVMEKDEVIKLLARRKLSS